MRPRLQRTPVQGRNGDSYHSEENGYFMASTVNGLPDAVEEHVEIIIHNAECDMQHDYEQAERQINQFNEEIHYWTQKKEQNENSSEEKNGRLSTRTTIKELRESTDEKTTKRNAKEVRKAELEADLGVDDLNAQPKRRSFLFPLYGFFCVILSLALYFFYISGIDKGFFSQSVTEDTELESYDRLNEIFDPAAVFITFQEMNVWLIVFPIFPLALALVIHPFWTSAETQWKENQKLSTLGWGGGALLLLSATFAFDCILALQISKQIHNNGIITGVVEGEWQIRPINPLTWDLNIVLVLFCGFFASVLLSILFHFTLEEWKNKPNRIQKEIHQLETEMAHLKTEITNCQTDINDEIHRAEIQGDTISIAGLIPDIQQLERDIAGLKQEMVQIQSDIAENKNKIREIEESMGKLLINTRDLTARVAQFRAGWNRYLTEAEQDPVVNIERVSLIAQNKLNEYFATLS